MTPRPAAVLLAATLAMTACSGGSTGARRPSGPVVADFTDGPCRVAAPGVLALRKAVRDVGNGPAVPAPVQSAVRDAQTLLKPSAGGTDTVGTAALDLVRQAGFVRLQAAGNNLDPKVAVTLLKAIEAFIATCTSPGPSPS